MTQLEKDIEKKLIDMVEKYGGLCRKWVCPGWAGVPDRIILLPGGRIIFAETKRPKGGKLSKLQEWWRKKLRSMGFSVHVVWNERDVENVERSIRCMLRRDPCTDCKHVNVLFYEEPCNSCNDYDKWESKP